MARLDAVIKAHEIGMPLKQLQFKEEQFRAEQEKKKRFLAALADQPELQKVFALVEGSDGKIDFNTAKEMLDVMTPAEKREAINSEMLRGLYGAQTGQAVRDILAQRKDIPRGLASLAEESAYQAYTPGAPEPLLSSSDIFSLMKPGKPGGGTTRPKETQWQWRRELLSTPPEEMSEENQMNIESMGYKWNPEMQSWQKPTHGGDTSLDPIMQSVFGETPVTPTTPTGVTPTNIPKAIRHELVDPLVQSFKSAKIKRITDREALKRDTGLTDIEINWLQSQL